MTQDAASSVSSLAAEPRRSWGDLLLPLLAGLVALAIFLPGLGWGLPSREADAFLFGDRAPWTGAEILALTGGRDFEAERGADVAQAPLDRSGPGPILLNANDADRARIVQRYRLFSHQPDEFINFTAIAGMGQRRDLDPRLYQYGGLWLYPLAGLLGAAGLVGYVTLTGDLAFYLDHPEAFGRFYLVARLYSAVWGAAGAAVVFMLVRRLTASRVAAFCGAVAFALLPAVTNGAHEAKPHLAGATLMLWAVLLADNFVRTGRRRDAVGAGLLCGAASAMVISMVVSFALLPAMAVLRLRARRSPSAPGSDAGPSPVRPALTHMAWGGLAGVGLYAITNPFVIYRVLFDPSIFRSNIENSTAMYAPGPPLQAVAEGMGMVALATDLAIVPAIAGCLIFAAAAARRRQVQSTAWLVIIAAAAVLVYFLPLSPGKPAEYARFGIVPATALLIAAVAWPARLGRSWRWLAVLAPALTLPGGVAYVSNFVTDSGPGNSRLAAARVLSDLRASHPPDARPVLMLEYEPASWSVPPFDLWQWEARFKGRTPNLWLSTEAAAAVWTVESRAHERRTRAAGDVTAVGRGTLVPWRDYTPISWANKPFVVRGEPHAPAYLTNRP